MIIALYVTQVLRVTRLGLGMNQMGDAGLAALADACAKGALANCDSIDVDGNPASSETKKALSLSLKRRWLDADILIKHFPAEKTSLDMSACDLTDDDAKRFAASLQQTCAD